MSEHPFESSKYNFLLILNLDIITEKKGKFLSFLKAKAKPRQPRKRKTEYELKTTLQGFKKRKTESPIIRNAIVDMYGNVTPIDPRTQ